VVVVRGVVRGTEGSEQSVAPRGVGLSSDGAGARVL